MLDLLKTFFSSGNFMPHGHCYLWEPGVLWLHITSDALIALAYYSIPFTMVYFIRKRRDIPFNWMFLCFAGFIIACGTTHLMEVWVIWHPTYWLSGGIKAVTALVSVPTAIFLMKLMPQALAVPSPTALKNANLGLEREIAERKRAEAEVRRLNEELEKRVAQRTRQLEMMVTERTHAEEKLKASLREISDFKAALDEHAIVAMTAPQGKITYTNDKFCSISKYSREELMGQDHRIINSGHHPREFFRDLWTTIGEGRVWHGEIKNKAKDGSCYWMDTTIVPFVNEGGKPRQYIAIRTDITERKQAEEKILQLNTELEARVARRTTELEAANKELEAFSYSVSHDLRAPLRAVNGFADIVLRDYGSQLPEKGRHFLERVRNGGQQMGQLIDDLLAFARLNRQPVSRRPVNTIKLVQEVLEAPNLCEKGRRIEMQVGELPPCQGDPTLLRQVWINLISNAVKYSRGREPAIVEIGGESKEGEDLYFVRDNGVGFDMQYAHKLFGVFQRLHRADEFEGTGVGLAIVQRIVHRHGGRVWVDAAPNRGATFFFTIEKEKT